MKRMAILLLILSAGYGLFTLSIWKLNDGFRLSHIQGTFTSSHKEPLEVALPQKFYYLGKGSQCYVFESEDHELVIKFFRFPRYHLHPILHLFNQPAFLAEIYHQKEELKQKKLNALLLSCQIAANELREECGLTYLHLNHTDHLHKTVTLFDRLKHRYEIHLDDYAFIIQKKGEQIYPYLTGLINNDQKEEAKVALASLARLLNSRIKKGIYDNDAVIHKNLGFCQGKALFIDIGSFSIGETSSEGSEKITRELRIWLQERDPTLAKEFDQLLKRNAETPAGF